MPIYEYRKNYFKKEQHCMSIPLAMLQVYNDFTSGNAKPVKIIEGEKKIYGIRHMFKYWDNKGWEYKI